MEIKKITNNILSFIIKRFIEIFGFCVSLLGLVLLASLLTYSPEDPNFIFSENTEIKNILGYRGSFVSDFFSRDRMMHSGDVVAANPSLHAELLKHLAKARK